MIAGAPRRSGRRKQPRSRTPRFKDARRFFGLEQGQVIVDRQARATRHLAADLGASSGRVVAGQLINGRIELETVSRFRVPLQNDADCGYQCWGIDQILAEIRAGLERSAAQRAVASVGVDSWGVDYVLLDGNLQRVGKAASYRDKRTAGRMERVWSRVPAAEIYRRTGIQFQPYNTLYQLAAAAEQQPEWMARARHLLMIPDYLHFCLSGAVSNEYTNATTTQMCNVEGGWDPVLLEAAGLARNLMQPPAAAGTVLGETQTGAGPVKVIAPATHDTASAVLGVPLEDASEAYISSGTWSLMGVESLTPIATGAAMRMNFTNEGGFGRRFRVLKNLAGMWPIQRICEEMHIDDVSLLVAQAAAEPAWTSLINPSDALFLNPSSMAEAIRAYCRQTGQPPPQTVARLARCVFDSLALAYRNVKEELELLLGSKLSRIRIVGGGCQNELLNQLCSDACELPVGAGPVEASALGNVCAQMMALGAVADLNAARELIRASFPVREYRPRAGVPGAADEKFKQLLQTAYRE